MLFYEPLFLVFFPAMYAVYLAIPDGATARKWWLLAGSLFFYTWGEPVFVLVLLASAALDYALSLQLDRTDAQNVRRFYLALGIAGNLGILIVYKYADFIATNLNLALGPVLSGRLPLLHLALPIGVSFVVFEKITYLVDTFRGTSKPAARFTDYLLFVLFFPKLLAGPILKYHEMKDQIERPRTVVTGDFWDGFLRFARGLARKLLIADPLGGFADTIFAADAATLSTGQAWLGLLCFTLQIYFDFAGYSDMAIGLARMMGFDLRENFNAPYISRSITEFWRRWHISLTTFIRDYLYKPLGGNRDGALRTALNLWICFLLSGLWHGASWNFVLWGAYNGLFLTLDRLFLARWLERSGAVVSTAITLFLVMIGWAIFRSPTSEHLAAFLPALFGWGNATATISVPSDVPLTAMFGVAISLFPAIAYYPRLVDFYRDERWLRVVTAAVLIALYGVAIARTMTVPFQPFIYFRF